MPECFREIFSAHNAVRHKATKKGYFCVPSNVSIRNMDERSITADVVAILVDFVREIRQ